MSVDNYVIWSSEHDAWWGPNHHGYVRQVGDAGVYSRAEAEAIRDQAYIGWTGATDPPEVIVRAFVGVSPSMATLAGDAVDATRAGWSARNNIATRENDADVTSVRDALIALDVLRIHLPAPAAHRIAKLHARFANRIAELDTRTTNGGVS